MIEWKVQHPSPTQSAGFEGERAKQDFENRRNRSLFF